MGLQDEGRTQSWKKQTSLHFCHVSPPQKKRMLLGRKVFSSRYCWGKKILHGKSNKNEWFDVILCNPKNHWILLWMGFGMCFYLGLGSPNHQFWDSPWFLGNVYFMFLFLSTCMSNIHLFWVGRRITFWLTQIQCINRCFSFSVVFFWKDIFGPPKLGSPSLERSKISSRSWALASPCRCFQSRWPKNPPKKGSFLDAFWKGNGNPLLI